MSKNNLMIIIVVVLVLLVGYVLMRSEPTSAPVTKEIPAKMEEETTLPEDTDETEQKDDDQDDKAMLRSVTVNLKADSENTDIAQNGVMTLQETEEGLKVTLLMSGYESTVPQPAHIHTGICPEVGTVVYPLENVVGGTSTTTLENVTLADLEDKLPLGVNVHKSADEVSMYTACGDITL